MIVQPILINCFQISLSQNKARNVWENNKTTCMKDTITLQNSFFTATIKLQGGELSSLYSHDFGREIIWNGDPSYWSRHTPVLFPFVCKLKNGQIKHLDDFYQLGQHGFARDMIFSLIEKSDHHLVLELRSCEKTRAMYPFNFCLTSSFELLKDGIRTSYHVTNLDKDKMYFSLGAHPAFNCPKFGLELEDYQIKFEQKEHAPTLLLDESGLLSDKKRECLKNEDSIPLTDLLFKNDALMFTNLKSKSLVIGSDKDPTEIKISWKNFPFLGLWKPIGAPFLCVEPWQGIADFSNSSGVLSEKYGIITLPLKESFEASYDITVHSSN